MNCTSCGAESGTTSHAAQLDCIKALREIIDGDVSLNGALARIEEESDYIDYLLQLLRSSKDVLSKALNVGLRNPEGIREHLGGMAEVAGMIEVAIASAELPDEDRLAMIYRDK